MAERLTVYFITTDRSTAPAARAALERQRPPRPVVVVRNVRPLAAAYSHALACETEYCAIVDDDFAVAPSFLESALDEFVARREADRSVYLLAGVHFSDTDPLVGGRGIAVYHVESLRRVGFPDQPHVAWEQRKMATALGLRLEGSRHLAGERLRGTSEDVYKWMLWETVRWLRRQNPWRRRPRLSRLLGHAARTGDRDAWVAALGVLDGGLARDVASSKDQAFRGPLARTLDFESLSPEAARALVLRALPRYLRAAGPRIGLLAAEDAARHVVRRLRRLRLMARRR